MQGIEITIKATKQRINEECAKLRKIYPTMAKRPSLEVIGSDGRNMIYTRIFVIKDGKELQDTTIQQA
jgi:hypothetical protein